MKNRFWVRLAGVPLWLETRWAYTAELFESYCIAHTEEDEAQYRALLGRQTPISVSEEEVQREQPEDGSFPAEYLESLALYRKICGLLLPLDVVLFHCSALEMDGAAYLFTAPSGTGKSTHAALWRRTFGGRVKMINDDKPLLRREADGSWRVFGTPYGGKDNLQNNISQTVRDIVLLEQGREDRITPMAARDAYPRLLAQTYHDVQDSQALLRTMDLVGELAQLPVFRLECTISEQAVQVAYDALRGVSR